MCVCGIHIERKWWPYLAWHLFLPSHLFVLSSFLQDPSPPLSSSSTSLLHFAASPEKALLYYLTGYSIHTAAPSKPVHFVHTQKRKSSFLLLLAEPLSDKASTPTVHLALLCSALNPQSPSPRDDSFLVWETIFFDFIARIRGEWCFADRNKNHF